MSLDVKAVLAGSFESAWRTLEGTMEGVTQEVADRRAPGRALAIGAAYAHTVVAADNITNGMLAGRAPMGVGEWAGHTGIDLPMPMPAGGPDGDIGDWYRSVNVDLPASRQYAQAVWAAVASFIQGASDAELGRDLDMSFVGSGHMPLAVVFSVFVTGHINQLTGEISAMKGVHGLQGYPF